LVVLYTLKSRFGKVALYKETETVGKTENKPQHESIIRRDCLASEVEKDAHAEWESQLFWMEDYEDAGDLSEPEWTRYTGLRVLSQDDKNLHQRWKDHAQEFPTFYLLPNCICSFPPRPRARANVQ
jgi:hypothetical protein